MLSPQSQGSSNHRWGSLEPGSALVLITVNIGTYNVEPFLEWLLFPPPKKWNHIKEANKTGDSSYWCPSQKTNLGLSLTFSSSCHHFAMAGTRRMCEISSWPAVSNSGTTVGGARGGQHPPIRTPPPPTHNQPVVVWLYLQDQFWKKTLVRTWSTTFIFSLWFLIFFGSKIEVTYLWDYSVVYIERI